MKTLREQRDALRDAAKNLLDAMDWKRHAFPGNRSTPDERPDADWNVGECMTHLEQLIRDVDDSDESA